MGQTDKDEIKERGIYMDVKFYMKRDGVNPNYIDLESYFKGMKYMECEGLEDLGKPKNIYTETYADADTLRAYIPNPTDIKREATTITFTFAFFGDNRQTVYNKFNVYTKGRKIYYYDTARLKEAYMVLMDKTSPKEDVYKGKPYMVVEYKFQNLWGECKPKVTLPTFELVGSSTTGTVGKSISFTFNIDGTQLQGTKDVALYINGKFEKTGDEGLNYIVYSPNKGGFYRAQAKYYHNNYLLESNIWTFGVPVDSNPNQPQD